jgi:hypothetical protein
MTGPHEQNAPKRAGRRDDSKELRRAAVNRQAQPAAQAAVRKAAEINPPWWRLWQTSEEQATFQEARAAWQSLQGKRQPPQKARQGYTPPGQSGLRHEQVAGEAVSQRSGPSPSDGPPSRKGKGRDPGEAARAKITPARLAPPPPRMAPPVVSPEQGSGAGQRESSSSHAPESSSSRLSRIKARQGQLEVKQAQQEAGRRRDQSHEGPER